MGCRMADYIGVSTASIDTGVVEADCETFGRRIGIVFGDGGDTGTV